MAVGRLDVDACVEVAAAGRDAAITALPRRPIAALPLGREASLFVLA